MARISDPKDVHYLALEGGGGKGVTYLGAVAALERLGVLPIDIERRGKNRIRGISGASAGAITAMFLAMGYNSKELTKVINDQKTFTAFFDQPKIGISRSVNRKNVPGQHIDVPKGIQPAKHILQQGKRIKGLSSLIKYVGFLVKRGMLGPKTDPIIKMLSTQPESYLYNLIFDRGMFPGFAVRQFLNRSLYDRLRPLMLKKFKQNRQSVPIIGMNGSEINFDVFYDLTGVDLVITGANITKHKPAVFSKRHTPHFPVAEAVGISMNLPVLFKPVHVESEVPKGLYNNHANDYHGMWIDGGVLNNFPLHAFDFLSPIVSKYPNLRPLNPNMLGLRLTDEPSSQPAQPGPFDILLEHLGNVMETVLYPSEEGQIRTQDERDQTIDLLTYGLKTTNFAPTMGQRMKPIKKAEEKVNRYFAKP